jgi:hypothetical protein
MAEKRRKFFEKYAKDQGFDPLIPENWYSQTYENIVAVTVSLKQTFTIYILIYINLVMLLCYLFMLFIYVIYLYSQGGSKVLSYHKDSMVQALITLFPNVNFKKQHFRPPSKFLHSLIPSIH